MIRALALLILGAAAFGTGCDARPSPVGNAVSNQYQPGQVWTYRTRAGEEASRLVILKLEQDPKLGTIVHVAVNGFAIPNPLAPAGETTEATHLPFASGAMDRSVLEQVDARPVPDFREGYDTWRAAFDDGKAGIFTITVKEALDVMERTLNEGRAAAE